jgi:hypothetical protein
MAVQINELRKITYLDVETLGERTVLLMALWDGTDWHKWIDIGEELQEFKIIDLVHANYVGKKASSPDDLWIPFIDFLWQQASWPEILRLINALCDDCHLLATSSEKLRHFFNSREMIPQNAISSFVKSELEYLIILCRTMFDLLHEIIATLMYSRMKMLDPALELRRKQAKLPNSYAKMVLNGDTIKKSEELVEKYVISPKLAEEYIKHAPFFLSLRTARNRIVHGGTEMPHIFVMEKGFCVNPKDKIFADFKGWKESHQYNKNLVSLLP